MTTLEIAVTTVEDAVQAAAGGAKSVELSYDLAVGGLTAEHGVMQAVRDAVTIPVYVILRPHAESFIYSESQVDEMLKRLEAIKGLGVDGVVFGAVDDTGMINVALMKRIAEAAVPMPVTLHRALDESHEPEKTLEALAGIVPRVLTSGPAKTAWDGREDLKRWIERFGKQYTFVSSGSLTAEQLPEYTQYVKPDTVHLGSAARANGAVDMVKVRRLRDIVDEFSH